MRAAYYDKETRSIADVVQWAGPTYLISRINVPEKYRGLGIGSKLLKQIVEDADRENITLLIHPEPTGDIDLEGLITWYKRYGFELQDDGQMLRDPKRFKRRFR